MKVGTTKCDGVDRGNLRKLVGGDMEFGDPRYTDVSCGNRSTRLNDGDRKKIGEKLQKKPKIMSWELLIDIQ